MSVKDCIVEVQSAVKDLFNDKEAADIVNKIKNKIDEKRIAKEIDLSEERIVKEIADEQKKINLIKKLNALKARQIAFERFADNIENFPNKPLDGLKAMLGGITASNKGSRLSVDNYQLLFKNKYQGGFEEEMTSAGLKDIEFKMYSEGRHEMLNETNKTEVYELVLNWINTKFIND